MSYSNSPHLISQKWINFEPPREDSSRTGDPVRILFKKINGWDVGYEVDEWGKIIMSARKNIGTVEALAQGTHRDADISITLNTTQRRAPPLKIVGGYRYEPKYLEIDDQKDRITKSFEEEGQYYKREYPASSVLTPEEFFSEQIPHFQELLKEKVFNTNVLQIATETSNITKPYNRSWKPAKRSTSLLNYLDRTISLLQIIIN